MAKQTLLPKMETKSYNEVMGTLDLGLRENKLTVIFGSPGTGKSSALAEFASLHSNAHMILCSCTCAFTLSIQSATNSQLSCDLRVSPQPFNQLVIYRVSNSVNPPFPCSEPFIADRKR